MKADVDIGYLILHPYPETKADWVDKDKGEFEIRTPWIQVSSSVEPEYIPALDKAMQILNSFVPGEGSERVINFFLTQFEDYPLAHIKPRRLSQYPSPEVAPFRFNPAFEDQLRIDLPVTFNWDRTRILKSSHIEEDLHDASSVVTALRRERLLSSQLQNDTHKKTAALGHRLYVMTHLPRAMGRARGRHTKAGAMVRDLIQMQGEASHVKSIDKELRLLKAIRPDWQDHVHPETRLMMEVLGIAAETSPLALATLLDGFDELHHEQVNVSLQLAALLAPVSEAEVLFTVRLAETAEAARHTLARKLQSPTNA